MVKITIVGTGYVGLVSGTCLAEVGHEVVCCDISEEKISMLNRGEIPIYEPGLEELVKKNFEKNRLKFTTDVDGAIRNSEVIFSAVGTPMGENHEADLKFVRAVAKTFAENLDSYKIFINKSTVPVGTADMVTEIVESITSQEFDVVSNPEFLKEGAAVKDFLNPDRIVVGCSSERAKELMQKVYLPFVRSQSPLIFMNIKSAELTKYAGNAMLATRISFINEIARYCDLVGANVKEVAKGIGLDSRIGPRFLQAGCGYGGSCFPKDVAAIVESGRQVGYEFKILKSVMSVNESQKRIVIEKIVEKFGEDLSNKTFTIWGLAFKPRTDDIREAPALEIIKELIKMGANINAFDPIAEKNFKKENPELIIKYYSNNYDATIDVDALVLVTEWDEFRTVEFEKIKENMRGNLIVDGRNIFNPSEVKSLGFEYIGIGRQE